MNIKRIRKQARNVLQQIGGERVRRILVLYEMGMPEESFRVYMDSVLDKNGVPNATAWRRLTKHTGPLPRVRFQAISEKQ